MKLTHETLEEIPGAFHGRARATHDNRYVIDADSLDAVALQLLLRFSDPRKCQSVHIENQDLGG